MLGGASLKVLVRTAGAIMQVQICLSLPLKAKRKLKVLNEVCASFSYNNFLNKFPVKNETNKQKNMTRAFKFKALELKRNKNVLVSLLK